MTGPRIETCLTCQGFGELTQHADDGTHGCSHQWDRNYMCRDCNGTGERPVEDEQAAS